MNRVGRWLAQLSAYAAFAAFVGWLSTSPAYTHLEAGHAVVKLSFNHAGQRREACRQMDAEEIAGLPPNMRRIEECPRERLPVYVELRLDGEPLFARNVLPSGLWKDGAAVLYTRFTVPAGAHTLAIGLRDSTRSEGFDYARAADVTLAPGQSFVIDFDLNRGGFVLSGDPP